MASYKIYLTDGTDNVKTITSNHPKLDAESADFQSAGAAYAEAYDLSYDYTALSSETVVHAAS